MDFPAGISEDAPSQVGRGSIINRAIHYHEKEKDGKESKENERTEETIVS
jgi:hypothetical protein